MTTGASSLDELCINAIRALSMDAVQKANSGHPGAPMGAAAPAYALWTRLLRHNPANPGWPDRDRFVLSAGHASMLLYSLLTLTGYDLRLEELEDFRQWESRTPGHPERGATPGVELTTGPLGQGFAMGVGLALAERFLAEYFNRPGHTIVDHHTYGLVSDGDLMEGVAAEAASLAGTLGLGKLIYLYDSNEVSIEGSTALAFTENVAQRFAAYGWHVQDVDGDNLTAVSAALEAARDVTDRPSLIITRTVIGFGSPHKSGTAEAHGAPLGADEVRLTKRILGWPEEPPFYVPEEALAAFRQARDRGRDWEEDWDRRFAAYAEAYPAEARLWRQIQADELPDGWDAGVPGFAAEDPAVATRVASGKILNAIAAALPTLIGGSADLAPSTNTLLQGSPDSSAAHPAGRNLRFGVREHAMGAIVNGLAVHGGIIPYCATFLVFSDYLRPAVRLAALMQTHSIFVFTHDSVGLGEDGPTHQPIEHLASLRAMPGLTVVRPADANETAAAWRQAIERRRPVALILSRQNLPILPDPDRVRSGAARGGYILADAPNGRPAVVLIATGSEVSVALAARDVLADRGLAARVVSLPSWEIFQEQDPSYRDQVLPPNVRARVTVEAASPFGWERYAGDVGEILGIDRFGASAPGGVVLQKLGFTPEAVADRAAAVADRATGIASAR